MFSMRRFTLIVGIFLVFLGLLFGAIYVYFSQEPPVSTSPAVPSVPVEPPPPISLGLDNITVSRPEPLPFPTDESDADLAADRNRDDRVSQFSINSDGGVENKENLPRLVRLFKGPTAGYRAQKQDDVWEVQVVEQGRGGRYRIQTVPYSLTRTARGEFTRVVEGYPFANDSVLVLYESAHSEGVIRSAFVPFASDSTDAGAVRRFEDTIRVATNNENLLFFIQIINGKSVGVVVDVSRPEDTRVVWESDFTSWIPRWGNSPLITLHTPITDLMKGFVYLIDPNGKLPDDQFASFSSGGSAFMDSSTGYFVMFEVGSDALLGRAFITNRERNISIDLPLTLPEKCDGVNGIFVCAVPQSIPPRTLSGYTTIFPDAWYQGDISFNDAIIMVNAVTGEKKILLSPNRQEIRLLSDNAIFDVIHPQITQDGALLFFVNKYDMSLWMLRLD